MQGNTEDNCMRSRFPNVIAGCNVIRHLLREPVRIRVVKPIKIFIEKLPSAPGSLGLRVG